MDICYLVFRSFLKKKNINTQAEAEYDNLEPWIQWPSVHTGKTYSEHNIFRLGDIVHSPLEQFFEKVESANYTVGAISPMNAANNLIRPAYFIPDPWTNTSSDCSITNKAIHQAIKQAVNDNSEGKVKLSTYIILAWVLLTKTQIKNWPTYLRLFMLKKKRWKFLSRDVNPSLCLSKTHQNDQIQMIRIHVDAEDLPPVIRVVV